ncbi:unnamed protein product [Amoebophrya sp. A25]|nr:unnamed protein product [Amoebophrya sp. A25]|eukprot:GSA25T00018235001.1
MDDSDRLCGSLRKQGCLFEGRTNDMTQVVRMALRASALVGLLSSTSAFANHAVQPRNLYDHFGPNGCVQLSVDAASQHCVVETSKCANAEDLANTEFAFVCHDQSKRSVHSFGRGGFKQNERFVTQTRCPAGCFAFSSNDIDLNGKKEFAAKRGPVSPTGGKRMMAASRAIPFAAAGESRAASGREARNAEDAGKAATAATGGSSEVLTAVKELKSEVRSLEARLSTLEVAVGQNASTRSGPLTTASGAGPSTTSGPSTTTTSFLARRGDEPSLAELVQAQSGDYAPFDDDVFGATREQEDGLSPERESAGGASDAASASSDSEASTGPASAKERNQSPPTANTVPVPGLMEDYAERNRVALLQRTTVNMDDVSEY